MNRFKAIFFLVLFCASATFPQTTYYVSSSQGNDSNSGTSENAPFKSLSKVNTLNLKPGDRVLFKSGDVWEGQNLIIEDSGTESNRIVFSSYGSGEKPIITLREEVPGWKTAKWNKLDGQNIYWMSFDCSRKLLRLWIDDAEVLRAVSLVGDNKDGTFGVNATHQFFMDETNLRLYVYSTDIPSRVYSKIEYPGKINNETIISNVIALKDADYITIDGLDIQGGMYSAIGLSGSDYTVIKNCNVGKYSNWAGIYGNSEGISSIDKTSDYNEISNCTIDSDRKLVQKFYDGVAGVEYGIAVGNGAGWWDIHDNTIKDWSFGIFAVASNGYTLHHDIHNNDISNPDVGYGKVIQCIVYDHANLDSADTHINIYNNKFHDSPQGINICSSSNKIYFNIFCNITTSVNEHATSGSSGYGVTMVQSGQSKFTYKNNCVFNNTFYNLNNYALLFIGAYSTIANNIFANCGLSTLSPCQVAVSNLQNETWKNNLFFYEGSSINDKLIYVRDKNNAYSVGEFNNLNVENKTISGNLQYIGDISSLINTSNFSLPANSIARNAGIDITSLLPESVGNLINNLFNLAKPNIGAFNNQTQSPTGLKIFLEGPYDDGSMSTALNNERLIPKSQPYNVSPWNYDGSESVSVVPKDIVDWILVELRNPLSPSKIVARQAAFLRNDGSITALDGVSKISFRSLIGTYYVVIKHRNHLAVRSSLPVLLVNGNLEYDFTTALNKAFGSNGLAKLDDGVYGMYGGDTDGDGVIDDKDITDVGSNLFKTGYQKEDVNLNSPVNVLDYKLPNENKSKSSQASSE